ncbi:hypothetical protein V6N11_016518 [Hibiscus sabdariffa]|uniref:Disease resistance protein At4g27190-like leucine-rich repeats domain-containing protein n=1 Tax=Hibiscus sabdariffa TaxID=183260 RepID=A0ABR2TVH3_9ROSI
MDKSVLLVDETKQLSKTTESLYLDGLENVGEMLYDPSPESFKRLRFVKVMNSNTSRYLFLFSIAKRLHQLEHIEVFECENITELIFVKEEIGENDILELSRLRILMLNTLYKFNGLYSDNTWLFDKKILCPVLEELHLSSLGGIEEIWHADDQFPSTSFSVECLTSLKIMGCHKLKYVFTSSMIKSFVQLKTLLVYNCNEMQEIIEGVLVAEEEEGVNSSRVRVFPKLDYLALIQLPRLRRFSCETNSIEFLSLKSIDIEDCDNLKAFNFYDEKGRVPLLFEKVILPELEELEIGSMDNLERLWPDRLVEHSFSKLTSIELGKCPKLFHAFPSSMLTRFERLDKLVIQDCETVEEIIFESESESREEDETSCTPSPSPQFIPFQCLTSLTLHDLPNLKSIHHKMHTIDWPSLKEMKVSGCDKVEIVFGSRETSGNIQPLYWVNESTFPNLHQLTLGWNAGIKEIIRHCHGQQQQQQFVSHYFPNLKLVILEHHPEHVTMLPSYLFPLLSLPNLTLEIRYSSFKELEFPSEEGGEKNPAWLILSQITELRLQHLPELKTYLVPSSVSFRNLVTLKVDDCYGIIKLITHSTAKSLVQLKEMSIKSCKNIEEIVQGGDDDDDDDEIIFPQLNSLELYGLPKLESFCSSENYTFGFPSLEIIVLDHCPAMKMFSQGDSKTPMLHKVRLDEWGSQERWEGNLNSTVQQLLRETEKNLVKDEWSFLSDEENSSISDTPDKWDFLGDYDNSSTLNTQNTWNFLKDEDNPSTSNIK